MARFQCYVVHRERRPESYQNWNDCEAQVNEYPGAQYKGFKDVYEVEQYLQDYLATTGHGSEHSMPVQKIETPQLDLHIHSQWRRQDFILAVAHIDSFSIFYSSTEN